MKEAAPAAFFFGDIRTHKNAPRLGPSGQKRGAGLLIRRGRGDFDGSIAGLLRLSDG